MSPDVCSKAIVIFLAFVSINMSLHGTVTEMCEVVEHQCQQICVSSPASYRCECRKGFTLNPDGKTCKGEEAFMFHSLNTV